MHADVELALTRDGRMLAIRARIVADLGGYLMPTTAMPPHTAAMLMCGVYGIAAADIAVSGRRTNKVPTGPVPRRRAGPRRPTSSSASVDDAARELGIDPVELRRRNLVREFPHDTPLGWTYDSGDYERCLDRALELVRPERSEDDGAHRRHRASACTSSAPAASSRAPRSSAPPTGRSRSAAARRRTARATRRPSPRSPPSGSAST